MKIKRKRKRGNVRGSLWRRGGRLKNLKRHKVREEWDKSERSVIKDKRKGVWWREVNRREEHGRWTPEYDEQSWNVKQNRQKINGKDKRPIRTKTEKKTNEKMQWKKRKS